MKGFDVSAGDKNATVYYSLNCEINVVVFSFDKYVGLLWLDTNYTRLWGYQNFKTLMICFL